jgi:hypothetical protein
MSLSASDVQNYILAMLGSPIIDVELDASHFPIALNQALRVYSRINPITKYDQITLVAGQQVYSPTNVGLGIITAAIPPSKYRFGLGWGFGDEFSVFDSAVVNDLGHYATAIEYYKSARRVLSANFHWNYIPERKELEISPAPQEPLTLSYAYVDAAGIADITPNYEDWILEYSLIVAKGILGEIRELLGNIAGNQTSIPLNGAALKEASSLAVKRDKEQELRDMVGDKFMLPMRDS